MTNSQLQDTESSPNQRRSRPVWRKFIFEFLSIFIAVLSAFALNNWNEDRRDRHTEHKLLLEIRNGLVKDKLDLEVNMGGHQNGIRVCDFWKKIIDNEPVVQDSMYANILNLTRDYISIQNRAGYESLKSKGLELIQNDSLRINIITFYEYDFATLKTLEEDYEEMQFQRNYYDHFRDLVGPSMMFNDEGGVTGVKTPFQISETDRNMLLLDLWKIRVNRYFILSYYNEVNRKIDHIIEQIQNELELQSN